MIAIDCSIACITNSWIALQGCLVEAVGAIASSQKEGLAISYVAGTVRAKMDAWIVWNFWNASVMRVELCEFLKLLGEYLPRLRNSSLISVAVVGYPFNHFQFIIHVICCHLVLWT